ncbi:Mu transposase C-terminal domain-containing protein [Arthrobacter sp. GCM10027362]|uniref:Mu transposase C-terminal domain-containing protein n=1 Tax=Arthrobacter sp. GCM10027362 TaxID=3273379 RepID=UPI003631EF54
MESLTAMQDNPLELDPARPVTLDGVDYMIEGRQGSNLALFNTLTGQTLTMTYSAVMRRIGLSDIPLDHVVDIRTADARLGPLQKWWKNFLTRQVEEVAYGKPHDELTYRPEYDPASTTQDQRLDRKAAELTPLQMRGTSRSNLKKLVGKLKKQKSTGLVDGRSIRIRDPFAKIDARLYRMMAQRVAAAKDDSTATTEQLIADVSGDWIGQYPDEADRLPSPSTLRRKFDLLTDGRYTKESANNRRTNEGAPKRYMEGRPAFAPGEEVQVDSTTLDVEVLGDDGEPFRPILTTFICKGTHSILAIMVTKSVKGVDLAYLLAKALSIPDLRPGPDLPYNLNELRRLPWAEAHIEADLEGKDTGRPIIMIRRIVTDLGPDYQSNAFLAACHQFCIDVTNAAPGTGTDKAIVERSHRTIKDLFCRYLPGFTGGNPDNRGKNIDHISIHTLAYVLDLWVRHVWQNLETSALRNPEHPGRRYSPNTMYEALTYRTGCLYAPISPDTYISLLPVEDHKIGRMGFQMSHRRYDTPALNPYRGKPSGNALLGDLWEVHYDPNNPAMVWVRIPDLECFPDAGAYIECPWVNAEAFDAPFSRAIREAAENLAQLGYQITSRERHALSRRIVKGAYAAAEKEDRDAEKREAAEKLAAEQGMARPNPKQVVEPEVPSSVSPGVEDTNGYDLFDPDAMVDAMDARQYDTPDTDSAGTSSESEVSGSEMTAVVSPDPDNHADD